MEKEKINIYKKIFNIKSAVNSITKDGIGMFGEKALKLSAVLSSINKAAFDQNVLITESVRDIVINTDNQTVAGVIDVFATDVETGVFIKTSHPYVGKENNKDMGFALGKASTYSRKYAYLQAFGLPTNDKDPDFEKPSVKAKGTNWGGDLFTNEKEIEKNTVETNTAPKGNIFGKPTTKKVEAQTSEEISKTLDEIIKNNPTKGDV